MKKILSLVLTSALTFGVLAGCANNDTPVETPAETPAVETPAVETPAVDTPAEAGGIAKMGLGIITSVASSKELAEGKALGQVDTTIAVVGLDADGKIASITIDTAQQKVDFDGDMKVTSDITAEGKTKFELEDDYGMRNASPIKREWFEQITDLENWMMGKTIDEVTGMKLEEAVPQEEDLMSTVTMKVSGYIAAVEKAVKNAIDVEGAVKVGAGEVISLAKSKDMDGDKGAAAQVDTTIVATALDADGKVVATKIDVAQTIVGFDVDGKITNDVTVDAKSKKERGDDYGMKAISEIGKEWYEQAEALEAWMVGKTPDEITGMKVFERDPAHKEVPDVEDLKSSVTITVGDYLAAFKEAAEQAR
ncbi:MAG: hypothetical protein GX829_05800 [Clostridium sp.]|jgi:uncharacterized protein YuzE|nr:hypothetical protein [Clostridium sp.]